MLRAGVELNKVRAWLGHASLETTLIYADLDLEAKARAIAFATRTNRLRPAPFVTTRD